MKGLPQRSISKMSQYGETGKRKRLLRTRGSEAPSQSLWQSSQNMDPNHWLSPFPKKKVGHCVTSELGQWLVSGIHLSQMGNFPLVNSSS